MRERLAALAFAATLGLGCELGSSAEKGDRATGVREADDADPKPSPAAAEIATRDYPQAKCTARAVLYREMYAWLAQGDYDRIEEMLAEYRAAYAENPACESYLWRTLSPLSGRPIEELDAWVRARPDSAGAYTARGEHWVDEGYRRRGTKFSRDVTERQWAGMREAFAQAESDLERAIELEPSQSMACGELLHMFKAQGDEDVILRELELCAERDPLNVGLRQRAMQALDPQWGGTLEGTQAVIDGAKAHFDQNPPLRVLEGYPLGARAHKAYMRKDYAEAIRLYREALSHGDEHDWYHTLTWAYSQSEDWAGLRVAADTWSKRMGAKKSAEIFRALARTQLGEHVEALAVLDRAVLDWPNDSGMHRRRARALAQLGKDRESVESLLKAFELDPRDDELLAVLDQALRGPQHQKQRESVAKAAVEANPERPLAWFMIGSALLERGDSEGRVWLERFVAAERDAGDDAIQLALARRLLDPEATGRDGESARKRAPGLAYLGLTGRSPGTPSR